jgi:hypothetical protein
MSTLTSETSSVDRSGAAQGLAEVVGGLGIEKMEALMPDIIKTSERTDIAPHVKDGYIMMFIYMPTVFPEEFTQYIGQVGNFTYLSCTKLCCLRFTNFIIFLIENPANFLLAALSENLPLACSCPLT